MTPSPQQQAVYDWVRDGRGSAFVEAKAGAGKTTTLIGACELMSGSVAFAAYNKKIAVEIQGKLEAKGLGNQVKAGTFHSFGFNAWRRVAPKVKLDARRKWDVIGEQIGSHPDTWEAVQKLVGYAKGRAIDEANLFNPTPWWDMVNHYGLEDDLENPELMPQVVEQAMKALRASIDVSADFIDFDDMIYLPVITGTKVWENDWLLTDEAQDTNPARRGLARKMLRHNGRAIFVGDRAQAIYGFTGADNDAVDQIIRDFNCTRLPLTVSYRCPRAVIAEARAIVPGIEAADTAPQGAVQTVEMEEFLQKAKTLLPTDAILCRNNRPLISLAYQLIRQGIGCRVEGRDIGQGLKKLLRQWKVKNVQVFLAKLDTWTETQANKKIAKGDTMGAEAIRDRSDSLVIICEGCTNISEVEAKIDQLFADTENFKSPILTLSSVHKSKGREWPRVFILGRNRYMPSPYARSAWQQEQEANLEYVAITRAQERLVYITVPYSDE